MSGNIRKSRSVLPVVLILCAVLAAAFLVMQRNNKTEKNPAEDLPFSVLIMGDSQMAGDGWQGAYGNCISEYYPNALVINLAQSGALLANGNIHAQWEYYLSETDLKPDYILLDGGVNDLSYLKKEKFPEGGFNLVSNALCALIEHIHAESPDTHIIYTLMPPLAEWEESEEGLPSYDIQENYWKHMNSVAGTYAYVTVVDLFTVDPFEYPNIASYQKNLADSVHLSEAGYRNSFEYINNALVPHLEKQQEK